MHTATHEFVQHVRHKASERRKQCEDVHMRSRLERKGKERAKIVSGLQTPPSSPPDELPRASNSTTGRSDIAVDAAAVGTCTRPNGSGRREDPILLDPEDELSDRISGDELPVQDHVTRQRSAECLIEQAREESQEHPECRDNMCAEFQFVARTFNFIYDDLLEQGYVLPSVLDMDVLRELANGSVTDIASVLDAPRRVTRSLEARKPNASQHGPPGASLVKCNLDSKPPVTKSEVACHQPERPAEEAQLRKTCGEPTHNRAYKPPVRDPMLGEDRRLSGNGEGSCSSRQRDEASTGQRAQGQTRSKLVYWTAEEDHELMLGMHDGLNASEIRRRHDLGHRSESAIRSRRMVLKRKYSEMFDHDERLERLD
ncbi:hypothetical protein CKM354_001267800 [Cercospora kikuchii]|uniref:Uncharacterized protein n=1 Tax=Cercospora kikuchii TaxID=84275 RepID=A0A9P3FML8_9PEZI|nr:uncharacterized protein CKM354_001267800 [Cercospora kikuchii]GIZ49650.1 hypothetical protein CKM354_001267800 [Cercospora kikuchii]